MERIVVAVVLAVVAAVVAAVINRRRRRAPVDSPSWTVPAQLDRADFDRPEAPWLVVVFTSSTCETCAAVWERAQILESGEVAVHNVEARVERQLHERYRIDAVPLVAIADAAGVVRKHFLGPVTAADLWAALAELR